MARDREVLESRLQPSTVLGRWLFCVYGLAFLAVLAAAAWTLWVLAGLPLLFFLGWRDWSRRPGSDGLKSVQAVGIDGKGRWWWQSGDGARHVASLRADTFLQPWLIVLRLSDVSVAIPRDGVVGGEDGFRRLYLRLNTDQRRALAGKQHDTAV